MYLAQKLRPEASLMLSTSHWNQSSERPEDSVIFTSTELTDFMPFSLLSYSRLSTCFGQGGISKSLACLLVEACSFGMPALGTCWEL